LRSPRERLRAAPRSLVGPTTDDMLGSIDRLPPDYPDPPVIGESFGLTRDRVKRELSASLISETRQRRALPGEEACAGTGWQRQGNPLARSPLRPVSPDRFAVDSEFDIQEARNLGKR